MIQTVIHIALLILVHATLWFLFSLIKKRNDVADIGWGTGFIVLVVFLFVTQPYSPTTILVYALVILWGFRLSLHIGLRSQGKAEDFRYLKWREEWGKSFLIRSYLKVYVLQGFFMLIISAPILITAMAKDMSINVFTIIGFILWLMGFAFETIGDYQLSVYIKQKKNKGDIMQTGLWRYTRHPNYFGEILLWWGIFIISLPLENGIFGIISPLTITFLLLYVSGIPMLEAKYKDNLQFKEYKRRTSAFFPLPPRVKGLMKNKS